MRAAGSGADRVDIVGHSLGVALAQEWMRQDHACLEYGSDHTPLLAALKKHGETHRPTRYLVIMNTDVSFVYISAQDFFPPVPAEDRTQARWTVTAVTSRTRTRRGLSLQFLGCDGRRASR